MHAAILKGYLQEYSDFLKQNQSNFLGGRVGLSLNKFITMKFTIMQTRLLTLVNP